MLNKTEIARLMKLSDNSKKKINLQTSKGVLQCEFLWFKNNDTIDIREIKNNQILSISRIHWDKLTLVK